MFPSFLDRNIQKCPSSAPPSQVLHWAGPFRGSLQQGQPVASSEDRQLRCLKRTKATRTLTVGVVDGHPQSPFFVLDTPKQGSWYRFRMFETLMFLGEISGGLHVCTLENECVYVPFVPRLFWKVFRYWVQTGWTYLEMTMKLKCSKCCISLNFRRLKISIYKDLYFRCLSCFLANMESPSEVWSTMSQASWHLMTVLTSQASCSGHP